MNRQFTSLRKAALGLVLVFGLLGGSRAAAQAPLNWVQNVPGNSKPIILYADDITTWSDKGSRVFLLKGRVWIEHGVVQIQVPQATLWVDEARRQRTGIYRVDLFADGEIGLHDGPNSLTGMKGHIELNTRGEIHLKAYRGKVVQSPAPADPLFVRAVAMKSNLGSAAARTVATSGTTSPLAPRANLPRPAAVPAPATNNLQLSGYLPPPAGTLRPAVTPSPAAPTPAVPAPAGPAIPQQVQLGLPQ